MKKVYLILGMLVSVLFANAQVVSLVYMDGESDDGITFTDELNIQVSSESSMSVDFIHMTNITENEITFKLHKQVLQISEGNSVQMCFGNMCREGDVSEFLTIAPEETYSGFDILYMYPTFSSAKVLFSLLDANDNALQSFTVNYIADGAIASIEKQVSLSLNAAPIPADQHTTISYSVPTKYSNAKIVVRNTLGSVVKNINIPTGKAGKVNVNVSDLNAGVYFYSIIADGNALSTKKLVVKH